MVHYSKLIVGKRYTLDNVCLGKLVDKVGYLLYFTGSEHAGKDEITEIEADQDDDFVLLKNTDKS
uniref:Uncharacterized protein n=1 Tax=viral metagenome TaxID=1070528 RepID=A0A6C0ASQ0_9ZZZZ